MLRSAFLTLSLGLALAVSASAQVYTNGAYATTYPSAVPPVISNTVTTYGIPSVPAINTPVTHVGYQAEQPTVVTEETPSTPAEAQVPAPLTLSIAPNANLAAQPLNLGVATVEVNPFLGSGGDMSGRSLGEIARDLKQKNPAVNARTYTNGDVDRLNAASSTGTDVNAQNSNYPANNGVITPSPQGAIASPAQSQSTTGNGPFAPKTQAPPPPPVENQPEAPQPQSNEPQANPPQSNAKPTPERPYDMAQNNPSNAGIPQPAESSDNDNTTLPKTATRLPLLGVLGFFSISMGLFVRYQRTKTAK